MMIKTITNFLLACLCLISTNIIAQNSNDWTALESLQAATKTSSDISFRLEFMPTEYQLYTFNHKNVVSKLKNAPVRGQFFGTSKQVIDIPMGDGSFETFSVMDTQILHPDLAKKMPNSKSYVGRSLDNPGNFIRFSLSKAGFHGQIFIPGQSIRYIDPYTKDKSVYISYSRANLTNTTGEVFSCETDNAVAQEVGKIIESKPQRATDDSTLRQYELALSCAGEYGAMFMGDGTTDEEKKANIMDQMIVTMTRVNGVYEKEMGITFQIIPNNFDIMFFDPETDPWDGEYNDKTQEVIDSVIGDPNYDIGHNFNTSGGGNAGCIGCICNSGNKGSGHTGLPNPTGDPFHIDYVAHEMGHQMGGFHTHNGTGTCLKTGNNTEVEPGSGSTIMGYAGICPGQDIQNQSDDYFHYVTIRDISKNIQEGISSSCPDIISVTNLPPTANAGPDRVMPIGTAFALTGSGTDPNTEDVLTYTWEQNDVEDMQSPLRPSPTATAGPVFRSRRGTTSPTRFFPQMSDILDNNLAPTWEVIPQVTRDLEFALTIRDNVLYGGQTADDTMIVSTTNTAGPFTVSSQNTATTWIQGDTQTILWAVANTNLPPVSSLIVDILFSPAGDFSDTIVLAENTPNDGSEDITVPSQLTSTGRLMVKASDHIFLDVNNATISIEEASEATFFITPLETEKTTCANSGSIDYTFDYTPTSSYTETTTFAASNLPNGALASFNPETASDTETTVIMTVSGFENAPSGSTTIAIEGNSTSISKSEDVILNLKGSDFGAIALNTPENNAIEISTAPTYTWTEDSNNNAEEYVVQVSDALDFSNVLEEVTVATNSHISTILLEEEATYYWRVKALNECAEGTFTDAASFTTGVNTCTVQSNNTTIETVAGRMVSSVITVTGNTPITDINVTVDITHTDINVLYVALVSPSGTRIDLVETPCPNERDIEATFDDSGEAITCSGVRPSISGTVTPNGRLADLNGENPQGVWTLEVSDLQTIGLNTGRINSWSLEYCGVEERVLATTKFSNQNVTMYPNPTQELLTVSFTETNALDVAIFDLSGRRVMQTNLTQAKQTIDVSSLATGSYLIQMTSTDNQRITKQLIIE